MNLDLLSAYLPMDRQQALAAGHSLPERTSGVALLADALTTAHGPQRGAEELTGRLNSVYSPLVEQVHRHHGSVVSALSATPCSAGSTGTVANRQWPARWPCSRI